MDNNISSIYLMDSNSFITPYKIYYKFSIVPTFWDKLNDFAKKKRIISINQVYNEICVAKDNKDDLQIWFENVFKCDFINTYLDINIINNYKKIVNYLHLNKRSYTKNAVYAWSDNKTADGWLIATAMTNQDYVIVTFENGRVNQNNPKIKNVANIFGIKCINLFEMMEQLNFRI
jgi:hypothetical protein